MGHHLQQKETAPLLTKDGTPSTLIEDFGNCVWTALLSIQDFDTICIKKISEVEYINCFAGDPGWDTIHINEKTHGVVWSDCSITWLSNNRIKEKIDYQIV